MAKYFVTGASGFIGSSLVKDLVSHGHKVLGLARSDASAAKVEANGGEVVRGELTDLGILKKAAGASDGVIHLGFIHDFSNMPHSLEVDLKAMHAISEVLEGTGKPLVYTQALLGIAAPPGQPARDETFRSLEIPQWAIGRASNEAFVLGLKDKGIRSMSVRLPPTVHGKDDRAFVSFLINRAKAKGFAGYPGEGNNIWPSAHKDDVATLYRLAVEKGEANSVFHAIAEFVPTKKLAEFIGKNLAVDVKSVPEDQFADYFGFLSRLIAINSTTTSKITKKTLGWDPKGKSLEEDILTTYRATTSMF
ncbi:CYFA0S02e05754g1_1 [Cyberlindnera fabianii]|uniref:CYFA0S02e05754g1_1 n=1 Tax=Cyberlindnera fabianii TaxID=36022 RepID=A0A061AVN3_CYBFA|nr:CYFA0S02e05754g1_1 [Cyberlindnera fabianii]